MNKDDPPNRHRRLQHVWIVDDDQEYLQRFSELVASLVEGAAVRAFADSEAVLAEYDQLLSSEYPDLLFVDVHMPGINGVELVTQLNAQGRKVPSVLMSLDDRAKLIREAGRTRASAFLVKPLLFDDNWTALVKANINFALSKSADRDEIERDATTRRFKNFYSGVNHDYRAPLGRAGLAVQNVIEELENRGIRNNTKVMREARAISGFLSEAREIVEDVKLITEDGTVRVLPEEVSPRQIATTLRTKWSSQFDRFEATVERRIGKVFIDKPKLMRTLSNLIMNANKYRDGATATCIVRFENCPQSSDFWIATVSDEGRGIPPQFISSIGLPGVRADNVGDIDGSGKGVAMAKRHCELHVCANTGEQGTFSIQNRVDKNVGVCAILRLPKRSLSIDDKDP